MSKKKNNSRDTLDKRISSVVNASWIAPMYFSAGITELLNRFNAMSDEELVKYMGGIVAPSVAREHVTAIYNILNTPQE